MAREEETTNNTQTAVAASVASTAVDNESDDTTNATVDPSNDTQQITPAPAKSMADVKNSDRTRSVAKSNAEQDNGENASDRFVNALGNAVGETAHRTFTKEGRQEVQNGVKQIANGAKNLWDKTGRAFGGGKPETPTSDPTAAAENASNKEEGVADATPTAPAPTSTPGMSP